MAEFGSNRDIRELMERWARWRHGARRSGGMGKTILHRAMDGMPGTNCPRCHGRGYRLDEPVCKQCGGAGRIDLEPQAVRSTTRECKNCDGEGEVKGRTCIPCRGTGQLHLQMLQVNPAFIRSTYIAPDDPVSERIDRLVCELRQRDELLGYYFVVYMEYCDGRGGTKAMKAERLGITCASFEKRLQRAIEWFGQSLADSRTPRQIPFPYRDGQSVGLTACQESV